jgi:ferredoxin--NADP+ reductase
MSDIETILNTTPRLPEVALNIYKKNDPAEISIADSRIATKSKSPNVIRHVTFDVSGTDLVGKFRAGQSIGILPPGVNEKGKAHPMRLYSVSSPSEGEDGRGRLYATTVKRLIGEHWESQQLFQGLCSNYLCSLRPGDQLSASGPSGKRFLLPEAQNDFNYVFFATGTGIAPFRGMIMDLMKAGHKGHIILIMGVPYRTDLLYDDYFRDLDSERANFHYLPTISREDPWPDGTRRYVQTHLMQQPEIMNPVLAQENTLVYICGLKGMETGILKCFAYHGLDQYLTFKKPLEGNPLRWDEKEMKRSLKPSGRMFLEVY